MRHFKTVSALMLILCLFTGCATMLKKVIQKTERKEITTGLFPCEKESVVTENKNCVANIEQMLNRFKEIRISDKKAGILGNTVEEVAKKGFTTCLNHPLCTKLRPNTQEYRGMKAFEVAGKGNFLQTFSDIKELREYNVFLGNISAQEYRETNISFDSDRICINKDESLRYGYELTLIILFEDNRVSDTVIKGGAVHEPRTEEAFLKCPSGFIGSIIGNNAAKITTIP